VIVERLPELIVWIIGVGSVFVKNRPDTNNPSTMSTVFRLALSSVIMADRTMTTRYGVHLHVRPATEPVRSTWR